MHAGAARSRNRNGRLVDEFGIEEDPDLEHMRFSQLGDGPSSYPAASRQASWCLLQLPMMTLFLGALSAFLRSLDVWTVALGVDPS